MPRAIKLRIIVGSEFQLTDGPKVVLLVVDHDGYSALCRLITTGRRAAEKGSYRLTRADVRDVPEGLLALWLPGREPNEEHGLWVSSMFPARTWLAVELHRGIDDDGRCHRLCELADSLGMRAVAAGDVHYHVRQRRALHDVMTAIRHRATVAKAGAFRFYTPDQILQDARRHGIQVLPVDVRYSGWDCALEDDRRSGNGPAIRMGLRLISGFVEDAAEVIVRARDAAAFVDVDDLCRRAELDRRHRDLLADAGALRGLAGHRHRARWAVQGVEAQRPLFDDVAPTMEARVTLPPPTVAEDMRTDYATTGTTLGPHPLKLLRGMLKARRCRSSDELAQVPHGTPVRYAGLVRLRQRPETASGVTFMTLEDEGGMVNAIVWRDLAHRQRRVMLESQLMCIHGKVERQDGVQHLIAQRLENWNTLLDGMKTPSRDFR